jgi:hypothetical protein
MPLTTYCSETDIDSILSPFGAEIRANDDLDNSTDPVTDATNADANIASCIAQATVRVNMSLLQRYTVAVCVASTWVRWCTAYLSARYLCLRRNNPVPESLQAECEQFERELAAIFASKAHLIADDGMAAPKFDMTPTVTNYTIDSRYARSKVRRIPTTSTGGSQTGDRQQRNMREYVWWW